MQHLDKDYWQKLYESEQTGWDIGSVSTPIKQYFDQVTDKTLNILIPGGGNSYETEYLYQQGFHNVYLMDWAHAPLQNFKKRNPSFPDAQLLQEDFFLHKGKYDIVVEQTFFCAIDINLRQAYAKQVAQLLKKEGRLIGLLFGRVFEKEGPPFGGTMEEYKEYFAPYFDFHTFEACYNSIKPRMGAELFVNLRVK